MVKELIPVAIPLLVHNNLEVIRCIYTIIDFIIQAQYRLHNDKTLLT